MNPIARAFISVATVILVPGADLASAQSANCGDETVICAAGSSWYQANEANLRVSMESNSFARYRFKMPDASTLALDFERKSEGKHETGKILLVEGRVMLTKGFSPCKGCEIDDLDLPVLNYQLAVTLLSQAFPAGPDTFNGKHLVDSTEKKRCIQIATLSAEGRYPPPWGVTGEIQRRDFETIGFWLRFHYVENDAQKTIVIEGEWKKATKSPTLDGSMKLKGWSLYTFPGVSIRQEGAAFLDYAAQPQPTRLRTMGELQESLRKQDANSKTRR